jgi:hypothetical protein
MVWPATPLEPVPVQRRVVEINDDGTLAWGRLLEPRELPAEWVLRQLVKADLDNDGEIIAMMEELGPVMEGFPAPGRIPYERRSVLGWRDPKIEDVRWALRALRALVGVWREATFDRPVAAAWAAEGFVNTAEEAEDVEAAAWWHFAGALNTGLKPFQSRVEYVLDIGGREVPFGYPSIDLYSAACRQIFNLLAENDTARLCENETCSVVFVHQLGGSQYGQYHKTGLRFCSPACARMETQRQYRRREKEKRGGSK